MARSTISRSCCYCRFAFYRYFVGEARWLMFVVDGNRGGGLESESEYAEKTLTSPRRKTALWVLSRYIHAFLPLPSPNPPSPSSRYTVHQISPSTCSRRIKPRVNARFIETRFAAFEDFFSFFILFLFFFMHQVHARRICASNEAHAYDKLALISLSKTSIPSRGYGF